MTSLSIRFRGASTGQVLAYDAATNEWSPQTPGTNDGLSVTATNGEATGVIRCTAVAVTSVGAVKRAHRPSQALARVVGLVSFGAGSTLPLTIQVSGRFTATTLEWDAVTGQVGGLTAGARYYLGSSGGLTTTPPSAAGDSVVVVGVALTATEFELRPTDPVLL